tara:strand:+ start:117 stop:413 length:297 start_codon:yes stop_codon:yes gene_type:complete
MILACLSAVIINMTTVNFTETDMKTLTRAYHVCQNDTRYEGCLKTFTKRSVSSYSVTCGKKENFDLDQYKKQIDMEIEYELRHLTKEQKAKALKKIGR